MIFYNEHTFIMYAKAVFTIIKEKNTSLDKNSFKDKVLKAKKSLGVLDL